MSKGYNVAVVGATGLVGQEFLKIALQRSFPLKGLRLLASNRSAGRRLTVGEWEIEVEETNSKSFAGVDLAFFSATTEGSKSMIPAAGPGAVANPLPEPRQADHRGHLPVGVGARGAGGAGADRPDPRRVGREQRHRPRLPSPDRLQPAAPRGRLPGQRLPPGRMEGHQRNAQDNARAGAGRIP